MVNYDVEVAKISEVMRHPNADKLEVIKLHNWFSIVQIGTCLVGESVIFIHPDAKLDLMQPWTARYANFVSKKTGRVKTIKLRGTFSEGLVVKIDDLVEDGHFTRDQISEVADSPVELAKLLGIVHYEIPVDMARFGNLEMRSDHLPFAIEKTDQMNVQMMETDEHLGRKYMLTRKKDGSSCTITVEQTVFDFDFHVCSRSIDLKLTAKNVFTMAANPVIEAVIKYFKTSPRCHLTDGQVLVLRGEVCGEKIQAKSFNVDCHGAPTFHLFEAYILNKYTHQIEKRYNPREFAYVLGIEYVAVLGITESLTQELVDKYLTAPASDGEGIVLWELDKKTSGLTGYSFKIRSKEYDALIG